MDLKEQLEKAKAGFEQAKAQANYWAGRVDVLTELTSVQGETKEDTPSAQIIESRTAEQEQVRLRREKANGGE